MQLSTIVASVALFGSVLAMPHPAVEAAADVVEFEAREPEPVEDLDFEARAKNGHAIVTKAKKEEGIPYVYGGGGCHGKSHGGFDCSGLTQYAVCQAEHKTIPRTAQTQYHSSMGKTIKRADAQAGDLVFWAKGGNCKSAVDHVGIWMGSMRKGYILNAAHTGTPVREQKMWTSYGGLEVCPYAKRFW